MIFLQDLCVLKTVFICHFSGFLFLLFLQSCVVSLNMSYFVALYKRKRFYSGTNRLFNNALFHFQCVQVLLSFGCNVSVQSKQGATAADLAAECDHQKCARIIEDCESCAGNVRSSYCIYVKLSFLTTCLENAN